MLERLTPELARLQLQEGKYVLVIDDAFYWNIYEVKRTFSAVLAKAFLASNCNYTRAGVEPKGVKTDAQGQQSMINMDAIVAVLERDQTDNIFDGIMAAHARYVAETADPLKKFETAIRILV